MHWWMLICTIPQTNSGSNYIASEIYMLQRLPMIAFSGIAINQYVYFGMCAVITGLIAILYQKAAGKLMVKYHIR